MNTISPVTESDMSQVLEHIKAFSERVMSTLVSYSEQAKELTELRQHVQSIDERFAQLNADKDKALSEVNALKADNQFLVRQSGEYSTLAQTYSNERDEALRKLRELETANAKQGEIIKAQKEGLDRLNQQMADTTAEMISHRNDADSANRQLDTLKYDYNELRTAHDSLSDKLYAITQALNPIQPKASQNIPITQTYDEAHPKAQEPLPVEPAKPEMLPVIEDKPAEEEKPWYARNPSSNW